MCGVFIRTSVCQPSEIFYILLLMVIKQLSIPLLNVNVNNNRQLLDVVEK